MKSKIKEGEIKMEDSKADRLIEGLIQERLKQSMRDEIDKQLATMDISTMCKELITPARVKAQLIKLLDEQFTCIFDEDFFMEMIQKDEKYFKGKMKEFINITLAMPITQKSITQQIKNEYLDNISNYCVVDDMMQDLFKGYAFKLVPVEQKVEKKKK